jgi:hypothetical protein
VDACVGLDRALPRLDRLPAASVDSLLERLARTKPDLATRLRALVAARLGVPYALGTLGERSDDDPDPVFRLDEADCTVLVLTTVALAQSRTLAEAEAWMGPANYHAVGDSFPVTYSNRLHFTTDRLLDSPLFEDLTPRVAAPAERQRVTVTLNRRADGRPLLPIAWERRVTIDYVPAEHVEAVIDRLPPVAGIAFVRTGWIERGLLVAHEGFLVDGRCLVHASSAAGRVVAVDLLDYLWRRDATGAGDGAGDDASADASVAPRFDGALFFGLVDARDRIDSGRTVPPAADGS